MKLNQQQETVIPLIPMNLELGKTRLGLISITAKLSDSATVVPQSKHYETHKERVAES